MSGNEQIAEYTENNMILKSESEHEDDNIEEYSSNGYSIKHEKVSNGVLIFVVFNSNVV